MMQNVTLSILRAQNKMKYRTVTLLISSMINVIVSLIAMKCFGYWGAALGTALSTISNLLFMNIYYHFKLNFKVISLFAHIMHGIMPCAAVATVVTFFVHLCCNGSWLSFVINAAIYMVVYIALLFAWGLQNDEKRFLLGRFGVRRNA
jgi:O-antigen/teichoic acid export membrane protein